MTSTPIDARAVEVLPYALPMRHSLRTAQGSFRHRLGWLLMVRDADGHRGLGDAAPWPGFGSPHQQVMLQLGRLVDGEEALRLRYNSVAELAHQLDNGRLDGRALLPETRYALELAALDLLAQRQGLSVAELLHGAGVACSVRTQQLLMGDEPVTAPWLKLKIGKQALAQDFARVRTLLARLPAGTRLRLDANGAYQPEQAHHLLDALAGLPIDSLEQPLSPSAPASQWTPLHRQALDCGIALLADESIRDQESLQHLLAADAIDGVVLKPMFQGGLLATLGLARRAREAGLAVTITSALESAVGRAGALHLASGLDGIHGLDTVLAEDFAALSPQRGHLALPQGNGLGLGLAPDVPPRPRALSPNVPPHPHESAPRPQAAPAVQAHRNMPAAAGIASVPASDAVSSHRRPEDPYALPHPLRSAALAHPRRLALISGAVQLDYATLQQRVVREASALAARGIGAGSLVALSGVPDVRWLVRFHALGWLGAAVAPLPPKLTAAEHDAWLAQIQPQLQLDSETPLHQTSSPSAPAHSAMPHYAMLQDSMPHHTPARSAMPHYAAPERFWPLDETRLVLATSGSTGTPKRVSLSTAQLVFGAFGSALRLGHTPGDRWLCCLPLHHVGGLAIVLRCAWAANTVVLHERFEAARVAAALDSDTIQLVSLVPAMLQRVLDARPERPFPPSLRAVLLGGAAASATLLERCRSLKVPLALTWGMTEAGSQIATHPPHEPLAETPSDCGPALAFTRVESHGERLIVRGPQVRGMLQTADRGSVRDGRIHIAGRADDVIISGGENIAPQPIEQVLRAHPSVRDALVVAVPSAHWGQRPFALFTRNPPNSDAHNGNSPDSDMPNSDAHNGNSPDNNTPNSDAHNGNCNSPDSDTPNGDAHNGNPPDSDTHNGNSLDRNTHNTDSEPLRRHCRAKLRSLAVPDHFLPVDALPRSALGKPSRAAALQLALRWLDQQHADRQRADQQRANPRAAQPAPSSAPAQQHPIRSQREPSRDERRPIR